MRNKCWKGEIWLFSTLLKFGEEGAGWLFVIFLTYTCSSSIKKVFVLEKFQFFFFMLWNVSIFSSFYGFWAFVLFGKAGLF